MEQAGFVMDEDGYLTKFVPSETKGGNWKGIAGIHVVQPGETLSEIASAYGLLSSTIIWENDLVNSNLLQIGQQLRILQGDGVSFTIKKGDTIEKIAEKYKVEPKVIAETNNIIDDTIAVGEKLFLPGAKKIYETPRYIASTQSASLGGNVSSQNVGTISQVNVVAKGDKKLVFPTTGKVTQGYYIGHYALDISDPSKAPIWAAAEGTVEKTGSGWNGGYGNMVIIDHGNGLKTLYAHMDAIYVEVGQQVSQGQVIGKQGNTGRVYGTTGIHLHFEVRENGVKKNPTKYY